MLNEVKQKYEKVYYCVCKKEIKEEDLFVFDKETGNFNCNGCMR